MLDDKSKSGPTDPTRREFLVTTGSAAAASVIGACLPVHAHGEAGQSSSAANEPHIEGAVPITLRINGPFWIACAKTFLSRERKKAVITGSAAHAQCM